jgi:hypothetical protein
LFTYGQFCAKFQFHCFSFDSYGSKVSNRPPILKVDTAPKAPEQEPQGADRAVKALPAILPGR